MLYFKLVDASVHNVDIETAVYVLPLNVLSTVPDALSKVLHTVVVNCAQTLNTLEASVHSHKMHATVRHLEQRHSWVHAHCQLQEHAEVRVHS